MATDAANTLLAEAKCLGCDNSERTVQAIKLALLRQILLAADSDDPTAAELLDEAKCYACLTQKEREVIELALLDRIATALA